MINNKMNPVTYYIEEVAHNILFHYFYKLNINTIKELKLYQFFITSLEKTLLHDVYNYMDLRLECPYLQILYDIKIIYIDYYYIDI